ncbi:hypothetical protein [Flavobacterium sp. RS13.1]|jgi:hypothetical protein|uniref:hypothetical protein n=1 Tax=Flavobacterium sp. RS13.1 TaxID=3400345 RepID=UPI003AADD74A
MKKIIGILGVGVIAATMFFSANNLNGSSSDTSLASLINMNVANAEIDPDGEVEDEVACKYTITINVGPISYTTEMDGTRTDCVSGKGKCWSTHLCF